MAAPCLCLDISTSQPQCRRAPSTIWEEQVPRQHQTEGVWLPFGSAPLNCHPPPLCTSAEIQSQTLPGQMGADLP